MPIPENDFESVLSQLSPEKVEQYVNSVTLDVNDDTPVSIDDWCIHSKIPAQSVIKLLNQNNLPVLRLGKFRGAYALHITRVLEQEVKRQFKAKALSKPKALNTLHAVKRLIDEP